MDVKVELGIFGVSPTVGVNLPLHHCMLHGWVEFSGDEELLEVNPHGNFNKLENHITVLQFH